MTQVRGIEILPTETVQRLIDTLERAEEKIYQLSEQNSKLLRELEGKKLSIDDLAKRWGFTPETSRKHVENYGTLFKIKKLVFSDARGDRYRLEDIMTIERRLEKDPKFK